MAGKIKKDEFAEFKEIIEGLSGITKGVNAASKAVTALKTASDGLDLKGLTAMQKAANEAQRLANQGRQQISAAETKLANERRARAAARSAEIRKEILEEEKLTKAVLANHRKKIAAANEARASINAEITANRLQRQEHTKTRASYQGLITGIRNLATAYFGLSAALTVFKSVFNITRELESQRFAFEKVIKSTIELRQTMGYLTDISKRYGLDLMSISERYLKFRAAAETTNLTVKETQSIFESFSKVGSVLGLRADELSGIFLALEQMLSKNCHAKGSLLKLHDGSLIKVEDITIGDLLMGSDGLPKEVLALAYGVDRMVRIKPTGKKSFGVNIHHIMPMKNINTGKIENIKIVDYLNFKNKESYRILTRWNEEIKFSIKNCKDNEYYGLHINAPHLYVDNQDIIHHNTVTTEELRRQLGERLPGAVSIMAASLKVSTAELNKMLRAGTVISEDTLPKFAETLELVFGTKSVTQVDTMSAAIQRNKTAWIELVGAFNASGLAKFFVNFGTAALEDMSNLLGGASDLDLAKARIKGFREEIEKLDAIPLENLNKLEMSSSFKNKFLDYNSKLSLTENSLSADDALEQYLKKRRDLADAKRKQDAFEIKLQGQYYDKLESMREMHLAAIIGLEKSVRSDSPASYVDSVRIQVSGRNEKIAAIDKMIKKLTIDVEKYGIELNTIKDTYDAISKVDEDILRNKIWADAEIGAKKYGSELEHLKAIYTDLVKEKFTLDQGYESGKNLEKRILVQSRITDIETQNNRGRNRGGNRDYETRLKEDELKVAKLRKDLSDKEDVTSQSFNDMFPGLKTEKERENALKIMMEAHALQVLELEMNLANERIKIAQQLGMTQEQILNEEIERTNKSTEFNEKYTAEFEDAAKRRMDILKENQSIKFDNMSDISGTSISSMQLAQAEKYADEVRRVSENQELSNKEKQKQINLLAKENALEQMRISIRKKSEDLGINSGVRGEGFNAKLFDLGNISENMMGQMASSLGISLDDFRSYYDNLLKEKERYVEEYGKLNDLENKADKANYDKQIEYLQAIGDLTNAGFAAYSQGLEQRQQDADRRYELDMIRYEDNVEGKLLAEAKYDKKKRKLAREQAILEKVQAVTSIGLNTAIAVTSALPTPYLIPFIIATGAIQMGTALAARIPAYADGTSYHKGGDFIAGEEGHELVVEPSGKRWITDSTASIYSAPMGSQVFTSDATQKELANKAMQQSYQIVGLDETNKLLSLIGKNTKNTGNSVWYENGRKCEKKGNGTYRY